MGWALKASGAGKTRFTENQKSYLTAKFKLGEQTGLKVDSAAVARSMMCAKAPDGNLMFTSDDFLTAKQISGFFSHLASKKTLKEDKPLQKEYLEAAAYESHTEALVNDAERKLVQKHPIVYDSYNLCKLASQNKLELTRWISKTVGERNLLSAGYNRFVKSVNVTDEALELSPPAFL